MAKHPRPNKLWRDKHSARLAGFVVKTKDDWNGSSRNRKLVERVKASALRKTVASV